MSKINKSSLRNEKIKQRIELDCKQVKLLSDKICNTLLKMPIINSSKNIMLYIDFRNEVQTIKLIKELMKLGKKVIIPYTVIEDRMIIPCEIKDIDNDLVKGSYGILEPKKDEMKKVDIKDIDVVVVPGVVFDKKCFRVGYGGGYYDRFLKNKSEDLNTIGLAYDFQIVDKVPKEVFDIPLEYIITDKRIIVR